MERLNSLLTFFVLLWYFLESFIIIFFNMLLFYDRAQAIPAELGTTINATMVTDDVTDVVVAPRILPVSTDPNIEVSVL